MPETPAAPAAPSKTPSPSLIAKYQLEGRLGDEVDDSVFNKIKFPEGRVDPATWAAHASDREAGLRERKAQMVLVARRCVVADSRMLEKNSE